MKVQSFQTREFRLLDPTNIRVPARLESNRSNAVSFVRNRTLAHLRPMVAPKMLEVHSFERKTIKQKPLPQNIPSNVENYSREVEKPAYPIILISYQQKLQKDTPPRKVINRIERRELIRSSSSKIRPSKYMSNDGIEKFVMKSSQSYKPVSDQNEQLSVKEKLKQSVVLRHRTEGAEDDDCTQEVNRFSHEILHTEPCDSGVKDGFNSWLENQAIRGSKTSRKNNTPVAPVKARYSIITGKVNTILQKSSASSSKQVFNSVAQDSVNQTESVAVQEQKNSIQAGDIGADQPYCLVEETMPTEEDQILGFKPRGRARSETNLKSLVDKQISTEKSNQHSLLAPFLRRSNDFAPDKKSTKINKKASSSLCSSQGQQNISREFTQESPPKIQYRFHKRNLNASEECKKIENLKRKLTEHIPPEIFEKLTQKQRCGSWDIMKTHKFQDGALSEGEDLPDNISQDEIEERLDDSTIVGQTNPKRPMVLSSIYAGRPRTIFFQYHRCCERTRDTSRASYLQSEEEKLYKLKYKSITIGCIARTFTTAGFKLTEGNNWNAYWGQPCDQVKEMNKYQKTNHFPGCWSLGRKDNLWRNLQRMKRNFPNEYNFVPNTYLLGADYQRFLTAREGADSKTLWIMKPCASACGRGIKLVSKRSKIKKNPHFLVSEYISNPHLINGLKYDLRLYVLVSCYDPLKIYLHKEGLVRFATRPYTASLKSVSERYVHLTNWSVNKESENFVKNTNTHKDDEGSKWSLTALRRKYQEMGIDSETLWKKIRDIIIKTIISVEPHMLEGLNRTAEHRNNCYELYGFDVLVDANLKPWLMEVNVCPSLNSSTPLDKKIKTTVICDTMNLLGFLPYDKKKADEEKKNKNPGVEGRKYQSKNINDISELSEQNCLELLSADDWNVLFETDEEWYRKGDFDRIFPERDSVDNYCQFFEFPRYNNLIVWKWLKSNKNFLERICPKVSNLSV